MLGLLYESYGAVIWLAIDRAPQVTWKQGPAWKPFFYMDPKIAVLFENSKARDSRVNSIVENDRLRSGFAKSHLVSSTEARERGRNLEE